MSAAHSKAACLKIAAITLALACSACVVVPTPPAPLTARTVTPVSPGVSPALPASGYCREYQQTVMIGGQAQIARGTSCLQADGTWKLAGMPTPSPRVAPPPPPAPAYAAPYPGPYLVVPVGPATNPDA